MKTIKKVVVPVAERTEIVDVEGGPVTMLGMTVVVMCTSYIYTGTLTGVNAHFIEVSEPSVVYETGPWSGATFKDVQRLPTKKQILFYGQIENMFPLER